MMARTAVGKLQEYWRHMEHWHPDRALAFGKLLAEDTGKNSWTGFGPSYNQRSTMPRNPLNALRNLIETGEKRMAYDEVERSASAMVGGQLMKQRTFREQMQDQIAHHKARIKDLEGVLESMTPEVEKFVEALQKANL